MGMGPGHRAPDDAQGNMRPRRWTRRCAMWRALLVRRKRAPLLAGTSAPLTPGRAAANGQRRACVCAAASHRPPPQLLSCRLRGVTQATIQRAPNTSNTSPNRRRNDGRTACVRDAQTGRETCGTTSVLRGRDGPLAGPRPRASKTPERRSWRPVPPSSRPPHPSHGPRPASHRPHPSRFLRPSHYPRPSRRRRPPRSLLPPTQPHTPSPAACVRRALSLACALGGVLLRALRAGMEGRNRGWAAALDPPLPFAERASAIRTAPLLHTNPPSTRGHERAAAAAQPPPDEALRPPSCLSSRRLRRAYVVPQARATARRTHGRTTVRGPTGMSGCEAAGDVAMGVRIGRGSWMGAWRGRTGYGEGAEDGMGPPARIRGASGHRSARPALGYAAGDASRHTASGAVSLLPLPATRMPPAPPPGSARAGSPFHDGSPSRIACAH
ncbi:hypothetical protein HYPSUDRAFT_955048 [Hypholoma sublateritium FD-334 SS-4]|uniref:Uncharacterized protein n=1 Tax=Hypholoma sublateritium (strain FD-334 SS-4) TaxID=945553 RepID=A0A0D2PE86_HYPSF|nr:hypothetical protein HYPSUDRAFT_955048 [Hypholoma sublateritium FD-334 SS-4]